MAIAGSMTTAYVVKEKNGNLTSEKTTRPNNECDAPAPAVDIVRRGETAIVAGGKMTEFRKLWYEAKNRR